MLSGPLRYIALGLAAALVVVFGLWRVAAGDVRTITAEKVATEGERDRAMTRAAELSATITQLQAAHARELAEAAALASRQAKRANDLTAEMEALRRDPSFDAPAAAVLAVALERVRAARAAGAGSKAGSGDGPGGAVPVPASPRAP